MSTSVTYVSDGVTRLLAVPFPYIEKEHVFVTLDGAAPLASTAYTWPTTGSLQLVAAAAAGVKIRIYRQTPEAALTTYHPGSTLTSDELETDSLQALYRCEELQDLADRSLKLPEGIVGAVADLPAPVPLAPLVWNASGTGVANGSTTLTGDMLLRSNLAAVDGGTLVGFKQSGVNAATRDMQAKLRERLSLFDFIPVAQQAAIIARTSTYDCTGDIQRAIDEATARGGAIIDAPAGEYCMSAGVTVTDALVYIEGRGALGSVTTTGTVFKATSAINGPMFRFTTASLQPTSVPVTGGMSRCALNGNALATVGLNIRSVTYGRFEYLRITGCTINGILADCGPVNSPSCQYNWIHQVFVTAGALAADCIVFKGNEDLGGTANFSLNYMGSIFTLDFSAAATGNGIVWKCSDSNLVQYHRHFGQGGGRAEVFYGSNVNTNYSARHNVVLFVQPGPQGILAKSGTVINSGPNRIVMQSQGNGSAVPTLETGALLSWNNTYSGLRGTFTPRLFGGSVVGTPTYTVQKGRWAVQGNRIHFDLQVTISAIGGVSGTLKIDGLPFVMSNTSGTDALCAVDVGQWALTLGAGYTQVGGVIAQGTSEIVFYQNGSGNSPGVILGSNLMTNTTLTISGSYPMAGA